MIKILATVAAMIVVTTAIHATFMFAGLGAVHRFTPHRPRIGKLGGTLIVAGFVFTMFLASVIEAFGWALVYLRAGQFVDLETAFYFSLVTFTSLGYGDIVLEGPWRLVSGFQAAVGLIAFGWTTALVVQVVGDVFGREAR